MSTSHVHVCTSTSLVVRIKELISGYALSVKTRGWKGLSASNLPGHDDYAYGKALASTSCIYVPRMTSDFFLLSFALMESQLCFFLGI